MMPPMQRPARVNLQDFKATLVKILGPTKESQYCSLLSSFLSFRLSKEELDRLVPSTIGKENVGLHNQFVKQIFLNVTCGEPPPAPASLSDISKPLKGIRRKLSGTLPGADEGPTSVSPGVQGGRSNGDGFAASPRKGRSVIRDRKGAERPSPLGNHRADASSLSQGASIDDEGARAMENGHLAAPDLLRPLQSSQYIAEQSEAWPSSHPPKRPRYEDDQVHDGKAEGDGAAADMDHEDEDEEQETIWLSSSNLKIPLGIPFCRPSAGGPRMAPAVSMPPGPVPHSLLGCALDEEESSENTLPSVETLRQRMQQGAVLENGLEGCDADSPHIVRLALDIHLQRIIKTVIELKQSRRSSLREGFGKDNGTSVHVEKIPNQEGSLVLRERRVNGCNQHADAERGSENDERGQAMISPLDFYVAMDLNHSKLGENYPILLEKALLRVFWDQ